MAGGHGADGYGGGGHAAGFGVYLAVFAALLLLTVVTVGVSYIDLGGLLNIAVALIVASVKATLVALYFMHLRYEDRLVLAFAIVPLFFLFLVLMGTLLDNLLLLRGDLPGPE
jgi:cytochrome c oxidase subunit IV